MGTTSTACFDPKICKGHQQTYETNDPVLRPADTDGEDLYRERYHQHNESLSRASTMSTNHSTTASTVMYHYHDDMDGDPYSTGPFYRHLSPGPPPPPTDEVSKIMDAFRLAVYNSNDSLITHYLNEYPSLDLLDAVFENGDNGMSPISTLLPFMVIFFEFVYFEQHYISRCGIKQVL